jgi:hypothetical protein
MPSTAIKISSEMKEVLEKDAKKWCRSVAGQANYYLRIGKFVHEHEPAIARKATEKSNADKKRTRKTS